MPERGASLDGDERQARGTLAVGATAPARLLGPVELLMLLARLLVVVPVVVLILASICAFGYATYEFVEVVKHVITQPLPPTPQLVDLVKIVDVTLVGVTLLIVGGGLYQLFLAPSHRPLPRILRADNLSVLKERVISLVILVVGVNFFEELVQPTSDVALLDLGIASAVVILALGSYTFLTGVRHPGE